MTQLIDVRATNLLYLLEFSIQDVRNIVLALDCAELVIDKESDQEVVAGKYLTETLYPLLKNIVDIADSGEGDNFDAYVTKRV